MIDREKAIGYLEWIRPKNPYTLDRKNVQAAIDMAIDALKERPGFIPCSERLPEEDKAVLVYVKRKDIKKSEMNGLYIAKKHRIEGDPKGNLNYWGVPVAPCEWRINGWSYFFEPEVVAWMPLPKLYDKE